MEGLLLCISGWWVRGHHGKHVGLAGSGGGGVPGVVVAAAPPGEGELPTRAGASEIRV